MLHFNTWIPYAVIAGFAYTVFVLISKSVNPFRIRKRLSLRRWRLARSLAMIFFILPTIGLLVAPHLNLPRLYVILALVLLCFILCLYRLVKYKRAKYHKHPALRKEHVNESAAQTPIATLMAPLTSTTLLEQNTDNSEGDPALHQKLDVQYEEFKNIAQLKLSLFNKRESLADELTKLKYAHQKRDAFTNISIAQRVEKPEIKDAALIPTAMDRKKLRLKNVKARKENLRNKFLKESY